MQEKDTSWDSGSEWYDHLVGDEGHYYHRHVVLPGILRLLDLQPASTVIDLACGQGILERVIPSDVSYIGIDLSEKLLEGAKERASYPHRCQWLKGDVTQRQPLPDQSADSVVVCLALQNLQAPAFCFQEAYRLLKPKGSLVVVLNHPAFRIPTLSGWQMTPDRTVQMRTVSRYMSSLKLPLKIHPSQGTQSPIAWAYHLPLSLWIQLASKAGFSLAWMEEWCSDKRSEGSMAPIEDRARQEFPLFAGLVFSKSS